MMLLLPLIAMALVTFAIQTVFLTLALWIMIKLQKLDYNFPGLLGSAALACFVDSVLTLLFRPWFGPFAAYLSSPFFLITLYLCVKKVTNADMVDVAFTIVVGGALRFGMNLWLISMLMGNLRPSGGAPSEADADMAMPETNEIRQVVARTNQFTPPPIFKVGTASKASESDESTNLFTVIGVSRSDAKSAVTIQTGRKTYTIVLGESALTQTRDGLVSVRFKQLGDGWVVLAMDGQETKLPFH